MAKRKKRGESESKTYAFLAAFLSVIGFILAILLWKKDEYVMFYAKQSLVLFIVAVIAGAVNMILPFIPIIGEVIAIALKIIIIVLWVLTWVYALSGDKKDIWLIGKYAQQIKL